MCFGVRVRNGVFTHALRSSTTHHQRVCRRVRLLDRLRELVEQRHAGIVIKRQRGLGCGTSGWFLAHFLSFQISLEGIEEQSIVRHGEPIEHLLLLLGSYAVVLIEEVEKLGLRFFQRSVGAGFQISQIREDALFELFGIDDGTAERLKAICQGPYDIGAGDMKEIIPVVSRAPERGYQRTQEMYSPVGS